MCGAAHRRNVNTNADDLSTLQFIIPPQKGLVWISSVETGLCTNSMQSRNLLFSPHTSLTLPSYRGMGVKLSLWTTQMSSVCLPSLRRGKNIWSFGFLWKEQIRGYLAWPCNSPQRADTTHALQESFTDLITEMPNKKESMSLIKFTSTQIKGKDGCHERKSIYHILYKKWSQHSLVLILRKCSGVSITGDFGKIL